MNKGLLVQWAIAKVVREARNSLGFSQAQLADFTGLSYPFISEVERGLSGMGVEALLQVAQVLQVDAPELMRRIVEELKRGPERPEKIIGRPRKTEKKAPEPGNAGQRRGKKAAK